MDDEIFLLVKLLLNDVKYKECSVIQVSLSDIYVKADRAVTLELD